MAANTIASNANKLARPLNCKRVHASNSVKRPCQFEYKNGTRRVSRFEPRIVMTPRWWTHLVGALRVHPHKLEAVPDAQMDHAYAREWAHGRRSHATLVQ
jgi:hypothetical protein